MDFYALLSNWKFVWIMIAVIVFLITNVCKIPIKHFTNKIKDERKRKITNTVILLLPFLFSFLLNFIYCEFLVPTVTFYVADCIRYALSGIAMYGFVERFFKVKLENPYETTEEGQNVMESVGEISAKKVKKAKKENKDEANAIAKFYDKLNKKD